MGQKVHPESMRVGYIHDWKSNWFAERNFADFLIEDVKIRDHIEVRERRSRRIRVLRRRRPRGAAGSRV